MGENPKSIGFEQRCSVNSQCKADALSQDHAEDTEHFVFSSCNNCSLLPLLSRLPLQAQFVNCSAWDKESEGDLYIWFVCSPRL